MGYTKAFQEWFEEEVIGKHEELKEAPQIVVTLAKKITWAVWQAKLKLKKEEK